MKRKRALVAGGAGFIGSHLSEFLLERDYEVVILDNLATGRRSNIEGLLARGVNWVDSSIITPQHFNAPFDEIYNMASPASPVDFDKMPIFILETASVGHRNLLEVAREHKARILFASSSEVYGDPLVHPQTEDYFGNVNPIGPRSCYDEAKRYGEAISMAYLREHKVSIRLARIFNTYGPRMRFDDGRIIPNFMMQALEGKPITLHGDGSQTRSFCFVQDLCKGLYALMQSSETKPTNIGNGNEVTVRDIAERINQLTNNKGGLISEPLRENDPKRRRPDLRRASEILKWKAEIPLEVGLKQTLEYFQGEYARGARAVY